MKLHISIHFLIKNQWSSIRACDKTDRLKNVKEQPKSRLRASSPGQLDQCSKELDEILLLWSKPLISGYSPTSTGRTMNFFFQNQLIEFWKQLIIQIRCIYRFLQFFFLLPGVSTPRYNQSLRRWVTAYVQNHALFSIKSMIQWP